MVKTSNPVVEYDLTDFQGRQPYLPAVHQTYLLLKERICSKGRQMHFTCPDGVFIPLEIIRHLMMQADFRHYQKHLEKFILQMKYSIFSGSYEIYFIR